MQIKASGRAAFIIAAGLLTLYTAPALACNTTNCGRIVLAQSADPQTEAAAAPEPAATSDKPSRTRSHHAKKSPDRRRRRRDPQPSRRKRTVRTKCPVRTSLPIRPTGPTAGHPPVAPSVANANAQMAGPATTADEFAKSPSEKTGSTTATPSMTPANTQAAVTTESTATDQAQPIDDDSQVIASDPVERARSRRGNRSEAGIEDSPPGIANHARGKHRFGRRLEPDFADWQDLHRFRRPAHPGLCRTHVHRLTASATAFRSRPDKGRLSAILHR